MDKQHGIKYPRALAEIGTTSRQKFIGQLPLFKDDDSITELEDKKNLKKMLFSFNNAEYLLFDGLCSLCMEAYDKDHPNLLQKNNKNFPNYVKVIERQDDPAETHYRSVLALEEMPEIFCGKKYINAWPYIFEELKQLAYEPGKKKNFVLDGKLSIKTMIFNIDLIYDDGDNYSKLKTLGPRRTNKQKDAGIKPQPHNEQKKIIGMAIDYYKPLFAPIIELKKGKKPGRAYIVTPPNFQLSLIIAYSSFWTGLIKGINNIPEIPDDEIKKITKKINITPSDVKFITTIVHNGMKELQKDRLEKTFKMQPLDMRKTWDSLALHDNRQGDYIRIKDLTKFVDGIFPGFIEKTRDGEKILYPSRFKEMLDCYTNPTFALFEQMAAKGDMNGGQMVPLEITTIDPDTGKVVGPATNNLCIKCMKNKSLYSTFTIDGAAQKIIKMIQEVTDPIAQKNAGVTGIDKSRPAG
jgi:hypothetical protein